ncbi:MAG: hypothetical protein ACKVUT_14120 [Gaiella sp.]
MTSVLLDLDVLGDTHALWEDWLEHAQAVLGLAPHLLPHDRAEAAAVLDAGRVGNWRVLLERFAEDRAPLYVRPAADTGAAIRRLHAAGTELAVFTDAPLELARVALAHTGAERRVSVLESGEGALARLRERFGDDARVVATREELTHLVP